MTASTALVTVFAVRAARKGIAASPGEIVPAAASAAAEIAAAWTSANPASVIPRTSPAVPSQSLSAADANRTAVFRSNARPRSMASGVSPRRARREKIAP